MSDWADHAACRPHPTAWWFPAKGDGLAVEVALAICRRCPVRQQCLDEALDIEGVDRDRYGIRGGTTAEHRGQLARVRVEVIEHEVLAS